MASNIYSQDSGIDKSVILVGISVIRIPRFTLPVCNFVILKQIKQFRHGKSSIK